MSIYDSSVLDILQDDSWSEIDEKIILEPFTLHTSTPGKDVRSKFINAFNNWLNVPPEQVKVITRIVNTIHEVSLMNDDIEDDSELRRGGPAAYKVYGAPLTINAANYVYFLVYQEVFAMKNNPDWGTPKMDLDAIVTDGLLELHRGQGLEIHWRDTLTCPTEAQYVKMVNGKAGGILRMAIKLMMAYSTTKSDTNINDYIPVINLFSVFAQIRDDLMNLESPQYIAGKGFADDIAEGKFSFPMIHGIHTDTSSHLLRNILKNRPRTSAPKVKAIDHLRNQTKSFDYTFKVLDKLEAQTRAEIAKLGGNEELEKIVDMLHVEKDNLK